MFKLILALLFSVLAVGCPKDSHAEPLYGQDILGLAKQDVAMIAATIEPNTAIGVLEGTFGHVIPPLETLLQTGKVSAFRAHLGNGPCKRANNCGPGEVKASDLAHIKERAANFEVLAKKYPVVKCYLSPYLEHDEKDKNLVNAWVSILRNAAPDCTVVISAFQGYVPSGVLVEHHGNNAKGDIISNDGNSLFDSDSNHYRAQGKVIVFGWVNRFNLRTSGEKTFTPPLSRTAKASKDNIVQVTRLLKAREPKPVATWCHNPLSIVKPELWKTNAEDYENSTDKRGDRPLFISSKKVSQYNIYSPQGTSIGCAKYYGPYIGGGYRSYVGSCSSDSAVTLMNKAKSEWAYVKGAGRCYLVNVLRRQGYFK